MPLPVLNHAFAGAKAWVRVCVKLWVALWFYPNHRMLLYKTIGCFYIKPLDNSIQNHSIILYRIIRHTRLREPTVTALSRQPNGCYCLKARAWQRSTRPFGVLAAYKEPVENLTGYTFSAGF